MIDIIKKPCIFGIVAIQPDGGIGYKNQLIFQPGELLGDMKQFKELTIEAGVVLMGRKTYDSFPEKSKPLPDRVNVVISRNPFEANHPKVHLFTDPLEGLRQSRLLYPEKSIAIIGGGEIYKQVSPFCEYFYVSEAKCENRHSDTSFHLPHTFKDIERIHKGFDTTGNPKGIPWDLVIYQNFKVQSLN